MNRVEQMCADAITGLRWSDAAFALAANLDAADAAKATPTQSAKTTQIGLVRRMVARCRNGIRPMTSFKRAEQLARDGAE